MPVDNRTLAGLSGVAASGVAALRNRDTMALSVEHLFVVWTATAGASTRHTSAPQPKETKKKPRDTRKSHAHAMLGTA